MEPGMGEPMYESVPQGRESLSNPFGDDPTPTPAAQPIPKGTTTQSILLTPQTAAQPARPIPAARQASYERPAATPTLAGQPLRRTPRLRTANGETLEGTRVRSNGSYPPLRFR
jgi:hypothetical protein